MKKQDRKFQEQKFRNIWESSIDDVPQNEIDESWRVFKKKLPHQKKVSKKNYKMAGVAATVILFLFSSLFFLKKYDTPIVVKNISKLEKEIKLPDGSLVQLGSGSQLQYNSNFKKNREVELKGNAFFNIAKDSLKQFSIKTKHTTIVALGTEFFVKEGQNSKDTQISLYKGRLLISVKGVEKSWALIKGELFSYKNGRISVKKMNSDLSFGAEYFMDLDHIDLKSLITFLEKRYKYRFVGKLNLKNKRVTLRINKSDSLKEIIRVLSVINQTKYEVNEEKKTIKILK